MYRDWRINGGQDMAGKFIVKSTGKSNDFVVMSIRIERELQEAYSELADKSGRSRNEVMGMALRYALDNLEFIPADTEAGRQND